MDDLVEAVYDCAACPELWEPTLARIRDRFGGAYATIFYYATGRGTFDNLDVIKLHSSPWDQRWFSALMERLGSVPQLQATFGNSLDLAWTQMSQMSEAEFHETEFYRMWVAPQRLRDCANSMFLKRNHTAGVLSVARSHDAPLISREDARAVEALAPHIRRAISINATVDQKGLLVALLRETLDRLATPLFMIGGGGKLIYANAEGEVLLSGGAFVTLDGGKLAAALPANAGGAFERALLRAAKGDEAIGLSGIGVPMRSQSGERAAAYVLPLAGFGPRRELGQGNCVVFITRDEKNFPDMMEILRTLFDFTAAEARVAALTSAGQPPAEIAEAAGISIHTVRSHLANVFAKAEVRNQVELASLVNRLDPRLV